MLFHVYKSSDDYSWLLSYYNVMNTRSWKVSGFLAHREGRSRIILLRKPNKKYMIPFLHSTHLQVISIPLSSHMCCISTAPRSIIARDSHLLTHSRLFVTLKRSSPRWKKISPASITHQFLPKSPRHLLIQPIYIHPPNAPHAQDLPHSPLQPLLIQLPTKADKRQTHNPGISP